MAESETAVSESRFRELRERLRTSVANKDEVNFPELGELILMMADTVGPAPVKPFKE